MILWNWFNVCIYPDSSSRAGYDTKSIFKQCKAGLNSESSFSKTGCLTKAKKTNLSNYHIYPTPPLGQDMTQGQFFKRSLTGFNSEFSFS